MANFYVGQRVRVTVENPFFGLAQATDAELYSRDEAAYVEAVAGIVPPIAPGEGNDGR